jgi:hypothetical protein
MTDLGGLEAVIVFYGLVVGSYGFGSWLGKTLGALFQLGISTMGDYLGIVGGIVGLGLFLGYGMGRFLA